MCLGNQARNANKAAMRQYEYQLKVRERNWMNTISQTNVERVQYDQTLDATHVGLGNAYAEIQEKYGDLIAEATQAQEERFAQFASESTSDQLAASGRTGASVRRIRALDVGKLLSQGSRDAYKLTKARREFNKAGAQAAAQARQQQMAAFAQNNIVKSPDIAPPKPVLRNVGQAAFMDALSIASSVAGIASGFGALGFTPFSAGGAKAGLGGGGNLGLNTNQLVARDTLRYGNTFPAGSF